MLGLRHHNSHFPFCWNATQNTHNICLRSRPVDRNVVCPFVGHVEMVTRMTSEWPEWLQMSPKNPIIWMTQLTRVTGIKPEWLDDRKLRRRLTLWDIFTRYYIHLHLRTGRTCGPCSGCAPRRGSSSPTCSPPWTGPSTSTPTSSSSGGSGVELEMNLCEVLQSQREST